MCYSVCLFADTVKEHPQSLTELHRACLHYVPEQVKTSENICKIADFEILVKNFAVA